MPRTSLHSAAPDRRLLASAVAGQIATPLYVIDTDGDQLFAGQPAELAALVPDSTYVRLIQAEYASYHCPPSARELTEQRMFDWLDEWIGR